MNDVRWCHPVRQRKWITLNDFSMSWGRLDDSFELRALSAKPWAICCIDNIAVASFVSMVLGVIVLALVVVVRCPTIYITISCCAYGGRWSSGLLAATPCHASAGPGRRMNYELFRYQTKLRYFKCEGFTWLQAFACDIHYGHIPALLFTWPLRYLPHLQAEFVQYHWDLICNLECMKAQIRVKFALRLFPFWFGCGDYILGNNRTSFKHLKCFSYTTFRDMTTRRNLGDPIYFRIDKSIYFEEFSPNNLLKILEIEADKQLSQIVNHEEINRQQVIQLAALNCQSKCNVWWW